MKKLYIRGVVAEQGMRIRTNKGEEGVLSYWKEPHKTGSTGRVYVDMDGRNTVSEFFPSVIGGEWKNDLDPIYEEIGKEFQDFDFTKEPTDKPPSKWVVKTSKKEEVRHLEIEIPENKKEQIESIDDVDKFRYVKKSEVYTYYVFTRKKRR